MRLPNITIKDYLTKSNVQLQENDTHLIITCPFCKKADAVGGDVAIFYVNKSSGDSQCYECGAITDFAEVVKKFGAKNEIASVENGVIRFVGDEPDKQGENRQKTVEVEQPSETEKPEPPVDISQLRPMSSAELKQILGLTIKQDEGNKLMTFLCELSAYTENAQFNISFNAPSSTGKSFIPTEVARLFPQKDVVEIGYCSPTAFFHDVGEFRKELKGYLVDLSRKILIFLDQPHTQLLERLRPLLSHDKKEINIKITDKSQKQGLRTKNVVLRGFPAVIFCTAGLRIDEQEATRFLLLSPEVNQEKIRMGISETIKKEADNDKYRAWLEENPERQLLKTRILAIRQAGIEEVRISPLIETKIRERFFEKNKILKPRHQRDIKRLISLIKSFALFNLWWRERDGNVISASETDFEDAFGLWDAISVSQELNLPPYIFNLYNDVILPLWGDKGSSGGIPRQEIMQKHYDVYGRILSNIQLRQQILPMLETAGLIVQETDPSDKRKMLIFPAAQLNKPVEPNNSGGEGGVAC